MREARARVPEAAYRQFHLNQLGITEESWLAPGVFSACVGQPAIEHGEPIWVGLRLGKDGSSVAWVNEHHHAGIWTSPDDEGGLLALETVRSLAEDYEIREVAMDTWQSKTIAHELGQTLTVVEIPMTDSRIIPASQALRDLVTSQSLVLPDDEPLREASARARARHSRRGWKIDGEHIGPLLALLLAVDAAAQPQPEPVQLLGWI